MVRTAPSLHVWDLGSILSLLLVVPVVTQQAQGGDILTHDDGSSPRTAFLYHNKVTIGCEVRQVVPCRKKYGAELRPTDMDASSPSDRSEQLCGQKVRLGPEYLIIYVQVYISQHILIFTKFTFLLCRFSLGLRPQPPLRYIRR
jgi:hypothetical protein